MPENTEPLPEQLQRVLDADQDLVNDFFEKAITGIFSGAGAINEEAFKRILNVGLPAHDPERKSEAVTTEAPIETDGAQPPQIAVNGQMWALWSGGFIVGALKYAGGRWVSVAIPRAWIE